LRSSLTPARASSQSNTVRLPAGTSPTSPPRTPGVRGPVPIRDPPATGTLPWTRGHERWPPPAWHHQELSAPSSRL
jgi:hypothetical protein